MLSNCESLNRNTLEKICSASYLSAKNNIPFFGRAAYWLIKTPLRGVEKLVDTVIKHPKLSTAVSIPTSYGIYKFQDNIKKNLNNVHSENPYMY